MINTSFNRIPTHWECDKMRHYFLQGWTCDRIGVKFNLHPTTVASVVFDRPFQQTILGHKSEAYYDNEDDYQLLGPVDSFPKPLSDENAQTIKDFLSENEKVRK